MKRILLISLIIPSMLISHDSVIGVDEYNLYNNKKIKAQEIYDVFPVFRRKVFIDLNGKRSLEKLKKYLCKEQFGYIDTFRGIQTVLYKDISNIEKRFRWDAFLKVMKNAKYSKKSINEGRTNTITIYLPEKYNAGKYPYVSFIYDFERAKWEIYEIHSIRY